MSKDECKVSKSFKERNGSDKEIEDASKEKALGPNQKSKSSLLSGWVGKVSKIFSAFTRSITLGLFILVLFDLFGILTKYEGYLNLSEIGTNRLLIILLSFGLFFNIQKLKKVGLETILTFTFIPVFFYIIPAYFKKELSQYNEIPSKFLLVFAFFVITFAYKERVWQYFKKPSNDYKPNLIDLQDLHDMSIKDLRKKYELYLDSTTDELMQGKAVLLDERDVDYDLLDRQAIIDNLCNIILFVKPDNKFVISLEGRWGSGKTTILNNVKRQINKNCENIVFIDEFDPWVYDSEKALLLNMLDVLLQKTGENVSVKERHRVVESLTDLILDGRKKTALKSLFFGNNIAELTSEINEHIVKCGKKFVFIIDNIDRAEKDNVILLFKLVGSVLDFKRVTYILSFDNERVKKIFENDLTIDYEYLKKIINLAIHVPEIDRTKAAEIYKASLEKALLLLGEKKENLKKYNLGINLISKRPLDVRDFKKYVNSVINLCFTSATFLNKSELMVMEYVKLFNFDLYMKIYENKECFVSYDYEEFEPFDPDGPYTLGNKFENLFWGLFGDSDEGDYRELLKHLFPCLHYQFARQSAANDGGLQAKNIRFEYEIDLTNESKSRAMEAGICSSKYFDLYFTFSNNDYTKIRNKIESLMEEASKTQSSLGDGKILEDILRQYHSKHLEILEILGTRLKDLEKSKATIFAKEIFENLGEIEYKILYLEPWVVRVILPLFVKMSDSEFNLFLKSISQNFNCFKFLKTIVDSIASYKPISEDLAIVSRKNKLITSIKDMTNEILKKTVNLYKDEYYLPQNILVFYEIYKNKNLTGVGEEGEINADTMKVFDEKVKRYFDKILNENNIYRFLYDILNEGTIKSTMIYYIKDEVLSFFTTKEKIHNILKGKGILTSDEEFLVKIFEDCLNNNKNEHGKVGTLRKEPWEPDFIFKKYRSEENGDSDGSD